MPVQSPHTRSVSGTNMAPPQLPTVSYPSTIPLVNMTRVAVVGTSCAGKSTLAKAISQTLNVPHVELDALYFGPNWKERARDEFRKLVDEATLAPAWICDGNYQMIRDIVWPRATALIWLDYSFPVIFRRAISRTFSRCFHGTTVCGENRESFFKAFCTRDSILLWVLRSHWGRSRHFHEELNDPLFAHLYVAHLRSPAATRQFLEKLTCDAAEAREHCNQ